VNEKTQTVDRLLRQLEAAAELRHSIRADAETAAARQRLRAWQAARLARTHADLLASPHTGPAAAFFLTDLYGPVDLGDLADDVKRIVPVMTRLLPAAALETVADAIELDALSEDLDTRMTAALGRKTAALDAAGYGRAYRTVGRRPERERQIDLIGDLGGALGRFVHQPLISYTLTLMRQPARIAGLGRLQDFLERGYAAFGKMERVEDFLDPIVERERKLMEALFVGDDSLLEA